jgi:hypothetical protein
MRRNLVLLALLGGLASRTEATSLYMTPDIPTLRSGAIWLPNEVARDDSGVYTPALALPAGLELDAIERLPGGAWLLSLASPANLGGTVYDPRDVVRYDGATYSMFLNGAAAGIPPGSNVDSLMVLSGGLLGGSSGDLVLGFDVPTTIGGATYDPADLVRYSGGAFSLFFDSSAAVPPIPRSTNLESADQVGGLIVMSFDVPTRLGATTYLPGQLVAWDGASFSLFYVDPSSWPPGSEIAAFALLANPGEASGLTVEKASPGQLNVRWSASCSPGGVDDYAIYQGTIGSWYSHDVVDCSDAGHDLAEGLAMPSGNVYLLVVPYNANNQGSFGQRTGAIERPPGASACGAVTQAVGCP